MTKEVCVVGAGRWGRNHVRTLHELGRLGGIVDSNPAALEELRGQYPEAKTFADLDAALEHPFDGFTVATPAQTHFEIGRRIIAAHRPVLIEKPITLKSEDARELKRLAAEEGVNLMVGHVLLFHAAIRKIKSLIDGGKIGKLQYLYSNRLNLGAVRSEENILWSFAPHDISIFQYFTDSYPEQIVSRGGIFLQPKIHDTTMTLLTYPGNIVGHIFVSWLHPFKEHRWVIIGSKGMLSYEDSSERKEILYYEKGIDWVQGEPVRRDGPTEVIPYEGAMALSAELDYFVNHLDGQPIDTAGPQSAVEVLEILEKATASLLADEEPDRKTDAKTETKSDRAQPANSKFFVHPSSFVDDDVEIGEGTKIWHFSHVQSHAKIGKHCSLGQNVNVGNNVTIGNHVKIQNNVAVYEGVEIEDYVFCGPSMVFTNVIDPRSKYPQRGSEHYRKTLVKEGASIGANATILCGHTVGRHAFIAAGAVVTKDVPDHALMIGVPAERTGWVCECGEILPAMDADVACPRCSLKYRLEEGRLVPDV